MYSMSVVIATRHEMSNIMPYAKEMFFHGLNFATKVGKKSSLAYILIVLKLKKKVINSMTFLNVSIICFR